MQTLRRSQWILLVLLTLTWGVNWPIMKLGVMEYPALSFRALSIWGGIPVLALVLWVLKIPLSVPRRHWRELLVLSTFNMFIWQSCIMLALQGLSGGRAAILGYTMPIFSALLGAWFFSSTLSARAWVGVGAAALGVLLLLWHEITGLAGQPGAVGLALVAAASWALGTQMLRRTRIQLPTLTLGFWMTALTAVFITGLALLTEPPVWSLPAPSATVWASIAFNSVMIFGFAHSAWFTLARKLPPVAATLSVMLVPVVGVLSGALWIDEVLHWQDGLAMVLMVVAIGSVLLPARGARPA